MVELKPMPDSLEAVYSDWCAKAENLIREQEDPENASGVLTLLLAVYGTAAWNMKVPLDDLRKAADYSLEQIYDVSEKTHGQDP